MPVVLLNSVYFDMQCEMVFLKQQICYSRNSYDLLSCLCKQYLVPNMFYAVMFIYFHFRSLPSLWVVALALNKLLFQNDGNAAGSVLYFWFQGLCIGSLLYSQSTSRR